MLSQGGGGGAGGGAPGAVGAAGGGPPSGAASRASSPEKDIGGLLPASMLDQHLQQRLMEQSRLSSIAAGGPRAGGEQVDDHLAEEVENLKSVHPSVVGGGDEDSGPVLDEEKKKRFLAAKSTLSSDYLDKKIATTFGYPKFVKRVREHAELPLVISRPKSSGSVTSHGSASTRPGTAAATTRPGTGSGLAATAERAEQLGAQLAEQLRVR